MQVEATLPHAPVSVQMAEALTQAASRAAARYPEHQDRIGRGLALAQAGAVAPWAAAEWRVLSQTHADAFYIVRAATCTCPDSHRRAPKGHCKHVWAVQIWKQALRDLEAATRYWAMYETPDGTWQAGTATWTPHKRCYLFVPEDGGEPLYAANAALVLLGHCQTAQAQWARDATP